MPASAFAWSLCFMLTGWLDAAMCVSLLVESAANCDPFIIARVGKPVGKVIPVDSPVPGEARRSGFLKGQVSVPPDFDRMGSSEIEGMFEGRS